MMLLLQGVRASAYTFVALCLISALQLGCKKQSEQNAGRETAAEWKQLSETEKATYIEGYTSGYGSGYYAACASTDKLFDARPPLFDESGVPNTPSHECNKVANTYTRMGGGGKTRPNYSTYTNVISDFYRKYPKYDSVPFPWLMELLADNRYTTADEIFTKLEKHDMQWTY